jgi:uncharacterized protein YdhG (YjbR/CyaY superfamily)
MATKAKPKSKSKDANPEAVIAWIAARPDDQRQALQRLREQILAAAPDVIETIAYGVPMYYAGTSILFGLNAFKAHMSFGPGGETLRILRDELVGYDAAADTVRFTSDKPLPAKLVTQMVKARLAVHEASKGK